MKPDISKLESIEAEIAEYKRTKYQQAETLVAAIFKLGMHISAIKYSLKESKDIRVSGTITHIGEGSQWYFMRMMLDPECREHISQNNWAPDNEVWLAVSDPSEEIEILAE
jgi:hypothetical protein